MFPSAGLLAREAEEEELCLGRWPCGDRRTLQLCEETITLLLCFAVTLKIAQSLVTGRQRSRGLVPVHFNYFPAAPALSALIRQDKTVLLCRHSPALLSPRWGLLGAGRHGAAGEGLCRGVQEPPGTWAGQGARAGGAQVSIQGKGALS